MAKTSHNTDLLDLSGSELLRLLVEINCSVLDSWCPRCQTFMVKDDNQPVENKCAKCGGVRVVLDDKFWGRASVRIKRAIGLDRMLLRTVKADWESL